MQATRFFVIIFGCAALASTIGCKKPLSVGRHGVESEGEEVGPQLTINETYDAVRRGVQLALAYDSESSSFTGHVKNITSQTKDSVRVEVHLSNGVELGPTSPVDLEPGQTASINLQAAGQSFAWWKAHAETGKGEHGPDTEHGGETGGEHEGEPGREHGGEHAGDRSGEHGGDD